MPEVIPSGESREFWAHMTAKAAEQRVPFDAMVELTYGCNLRCVHCYNPTHRASGELTTAEITTLLEQLATLGCFHAAFTGGEVFTRDDALDVLARARALGFAITILTNATLVTARTAERLEALSPHRVEVSIYGATRETYERVTRVSGSFDRFLAGVDHLRERALPVRVKMPVMTLNRHEVRQARALVEGWGIRFVYSVDLFPRGDGSLEPLDYRLRPDEILRVDDDLLGAERWSATGGEQTEGTCRVRGDIFACRCGRNSLTLSPYGRLNLCVSLPTPQYDLRRGTLAEGWRALVDLVDQANASPGDAHECPECAVRDYCRQGARDAWLATGRFDPCLPYFKDLAVTERRAQEESRARDPRP